MASMSLKLASSGIRGADRDRAVRTAHNIQRHVEKYFTMWQSPIKFGAIFVRYNVYQFLKNRIAFTEFLDLMDQAEFIFIAFAPNGERFIYPRPSFTKMSTEEMAEQIVEIELSKSRAREARKRRDRE